MATFYGSGGTPAFQGLLELVNRQALVPFLRPRILPSGNILDAGSGTGTLASELGIRNGIHLDLVRDQLQRCRQKLRSGCFVQGDLEHLPFPENCFDQVICSNVLHYTGLKGAKEISHVTRKGGRVFLAFLEDSAFTRMGIRLGVLSGVFPPWMSNIRLIHLADFLRLGFKILEQATVMFVPPFFHAVTRFPLRGLVIFELEKP